MESPARWTLARRLALPAFAALYCYVAANWAVRPWVLLLYAVTSVIAFLAYAIDKSAAIRGQWRIPERSLHLVSLAGGWPGALLAQQLLRHKCSKPSFVAAFWVTVLANALGFFAWHADVGALIRA